MKLCLLILISIVTSVFGLLHRCPHTKHFHEKRLENEDYFFNHCKCQKYQNNSVNIICQGLNTAEELQLSLGFLRNFIVDELKIRISTFHLSAGTFKGLHVQKLIFEDTHLQTLVLFSAFKGLEFELEQLQFIKCNIDNIVWAKGNQFAFLKTLIFEKTNLPAEMNNGVFRKFPSKLQNLKINGCGIRQLGNQALTKLTLLETIELVENNLMKITRSMFPKFPRRLRYLSLVSNPISELPEDLFKDMERLEFLLLSDTRITSLSNNTFYPVWNQLEEIYMNNIKINCDCSVLWMLEKTDAIIMKKPYCISHNKGLIDIRKPEEICPSRKSRRN